MRPFLLMVAFALPQTALAEPPVAQAQSTSDAEFRLGGAALTALAPDPPPAAAEALEPQSLVLPIDIGPFPRPRTESDLGLATVFVLGAGDNPDGAVEVGTFVNRGAATAGVSLTFLDEENEIARSEVFLDYAISDSFSIGLSGILDPEEEGREPLRQIGVNAEFATSAGAYLQGGFAGAAENDPVIGISIGLRF